MRTREDGSIPLGGLAFTQSHSYRCFGSVKLVFVVQVYPDWMVRIVHLQTCDDVIRSATVSMHNSSRLPLL